jgi:uncharacterized protein (DUF1501 family)
MKRRDFLKRAVPVSTLPFMVGGLSMRAYGRSPFLDALLASAEANDRVLVVLQMNGGNDGLNMVIPLDRYADLSAARANILIPESKVLPLTGSLTTGLHPAMTALQGLYDSGKLVVVQSVSYPTPNFSHFRATDIWLTGSDYNQTLSSGWMGRYLDGAYPGFPTGYPNSAMPDPLAIQIGSVVSPGLQGAAGPMAMAVANPDATYILPGGADVPPDTPAGHELTFIRNVAQQTQVYTTAVKTAYNKVTNLVTYPTSSLAGQLKIVARLVAGGLKTRVYVVNIGGFDTHSSQVDAANHDLGNHANLLGALAAAVGAFQSDLAALGAEDRVVGMTFSEFGRRIKSNSSGGTDHGTAVPVFVWGKHVKGGILGTSPVLRTTTGTLKDNLDMQFDFRNLYADIIRDWLGASQSQIQAVLTTPRYTPSSTPVGLIAPGAVADVRVDGGVPTAFRLEQNYPNPFNPSTLVRFEIPHSSFVTLEVYNGAGQHVETLVEGDRPAGVHTARFDASGLSSGVYFCRLRAGTFTETRKMLLLR